MEVIVETAKKPVTDDKYKISFVDKILDNVHGFIDITLVEKEIIALPIFKRLQSIKQLSLVSWVFPGAEHTRYIHSLGVMHIIDKMAIKLEYTDEDRQLVRLAALLHDIGHYPLSHIGESAYMRENANDEEDYLDYFSKSVCKIKDLQPDKIRHGISCLKPFHHEEIGVKVILSDDKINSIIKKRCRFINIIDVCKIITGDYDYAYESNKNISDKIQLLHSELDADRMDYLLRDASFSGTSYGVFDLGVIIKNLHIKEKDGVKIIGVLPKGVSAVDQYMINRFFSYSQVIYNRHVIALELMAVSLMRYMIRERIGGWDPPKTLITHVEEHNKYSQFLTFTDHMFWNGIYNIIDSSTVKKHPDYIKDFALKLSQHQEIERSECKDIAISDIKVEKIKKILMESEIYENIIKEKKGTVQTFNSLRLTNHFPKEVHEKSLHTGGKSPTLDSDLIKKYRLLRLQEGITVIDEDNIELLIDYPDSVARSISNLSMGILREYTI